MMPAAHKNIDEDLDIEKKSKHHRASIRRVSARPSVERLQSRTPADLLKLRSHHPSHSLSSQSQGDVTLSTAVASAASNASSTGESGVAGTSAHRKGRHLTYHDLMKWIQKEMAKKAAAKAKKKARKARKQPLDAVQSKETLAVSLSAPADAIIDDETVVGETSSSPGRRSSDTTSEGSVALEMLQEIMERNMTLFTRSYAASNRSTHSLRHKSSIKKLRRQSTAPVSDTDDELSVPTCDVILDNSKTISYTGGAAEVKNDSRPNLHRTVSTRERDAWKTFKYEIVRLTHTLGVPGWRRVPMHDSGLVEVERLSGALTNAVYVVTPPKDIQDPVSGDETSTKRKARPKKLLLRIYGAQVDHLIDREIELAILRRLGRKHIGPRLLGTFTNGRFEEFFNARALTAEEMRAPDISRNIAKRMRELHDGVQLLASEISAGPFVWQNIDKWMRRCERIVEWLERAAANNDEVLEKISVKRKFVGADFRLFKEALKHYRHWLEDSYGGQEGIRDRLIFAHNDVGVS